MRTTARYLALAAIPLLGLLGACSNQREPAEKAVAHLQTTLDGLRTDAQEYAAEPLQSAETSLQRLEEFLAKGDYEAVVRNVPRVTEELEALRTATETARADAATMLAEAQAEWNALDQSVPPLVQKLQARIHQLNKSRQYPKGMNKAGFEAAKTDLEAVKSEWRDAGDEFAAGQAGDAVRKARDAKARAENLASQLDVQA